MFCRFSVMARPISRATTTTTATTLPGAPENHQKSSWFQWFLSAAEFSCRQKTTTNMLGLRNIRKYNGFYRFFIWLVSLGGGPAPWCDPNIFRGAWPCPAAGSNMECDLCSTHAQNSSVCNMPWQKVEETK